MKNAIIFLLFIAWSAQAQVPWGQYSHSFSKDIRKDPAAIDLILAIKKENNAFWEMREKSRHFDTLLKDSLFTKLRPQEMVARTTFDTANAQFFVQGVSPRNAALYQFQITKFPGNSIVKPWHSINAFSDAAFDKISGFPQMAYLGGYRAGLDSLLIVDVKKVGGGQIISTVMVAWERIRPQISGIYTSQTLDKFFRQLQSPWFPEKYSIGSISGVLTVPSTNNNLIFTLQNGVFTKEQIQYQLVRNGNVFTDWRDNAYDNGFVWLKDLPPGNYTVGIRFAAQPQHVAKYAFNVNPVWYETSLFRIVACLLLLVFLGLLIFTVRQRRKIRQKELDRARLQLELKSIYAQLNPHFVFNALSSIQGLINKQDIKAANIYLTDFARLTRESLLHGQKSEIALHEEIRTLDTYLKLEQLRFGFEYSISVDENINAFETNIPALILQPLAENAVRHGVASMGEKGLINVSIKRSDVNMIIILTDNGAGIQESKSASGFGLKLTTDRIALLNELRRECPISVEIQRVQPTGTQVTFIFNNWF